MVVFKVVESATDQTAIWHRGAFERLNQTATPPPSPPIAFDQSVTTDEDISVEITLTAFDPNSEPLSYAIVSGPLNGILIGTPPNVTYTPNHQNTGSSWC